MSPIRRALALLPFLVVLASPAASTADIPLPATVSAPLKVDVGFSVGTLTTRVAYTATGATATATAPSISLGKGQLFKTQTCVQVHVARKAPSGSCKEITTDTRSLLSTIAIAAPTVSVTTPRPASGGSGYTDALLTVSQRAADGSFKQVATTWTPAGLGAAGIPLIAIGDLTATLPGLQGAALLPKAGTTAPPSGGVD